jgi:competence protein ComEC
MKKIFIYSLLVVIVLAGFSLYEYFKYSDHDLHLVMCDVGQGEAIFITTPSKTQILIDGGPDKAVLDCLSNNMPFWDRSIDLVILTHPHADHHTGLIHVLDRYDLKGFYTQDVKTASEGYKLLEAKLANKNLSAKYLKYGDSFSDKSGVEFKILWPLAFSLNENDQNRANYSLNESSVVAILTYGNFSAVLTGDTEENSIEQVKSNVKTVNVLKVPHHGSSGAVSDELLNQLKPDIGLISVGRENKFGHPTKDTLEALNKYNVKILRTDTDGEVKIKSNGSNFEIVKMSK